APPADVGGGIHAGMDPGGGERVAELVVVGGDREHHAHVELGAPGEVVIDDGTESLGGDRVLGRGGVEIEIGELHRVPHVIGNSDAVAVEIHGEGGDDVRLGADADGGGDGLTGEHVRAVEVAGDDVVEERFPVG